MKEKNLEDKNLEELLECPYWVVDILPERVPEDAAGQYFAVEKYYRQRSRVAVLHRKMAEIILRLNCYYDMSVSTDGVSHWVSNPDPEVFAGQLERLPENGFIRVLFESEATMIDIDGCDTYMTVYNPDRKMLEMLKLLAGAEGFFIF